MGCLDVFQWSAGDQFGWICEHLCYCGLIGWCCGDGC